MQYSTKMSDMASFETNNTETAKLLLCYALFKIAKPVAANQLYEITVKSGVINYFYYNDAMASLLENECVTLNTDENDVEIYELAKKGTILAKNFKSYIPKSFRDRLVTSAIRYFNDIKIKNEFTLEYKQLENGYNVEFTCFDGNIVLMDLKMFAPDKTQAELIGNKIKINPIGFYSEVLGYVINNKEEEIILDEDN